MPTEAASPVVLQDLVGFEEEVAPGEEAVCAVEGDLDVRAEEFLEGKALGHRTRLSGGGRLDDGERDDDGTGPRGHLVDPVAEQHDLRGDGGDVPARVEAEEGEVDFDVAIGRLEPAEGEDAITQAPHAGFIRGMTGEFQSEIGFCRGADVGRAFGEDGKAAVGVLPGENGVDGAADLLRVGGSPDAVARGGQPQQEQEPVTFQSGVRGEVAPPEAIAMLEGEEVLRGFSRGSRSDCDQYVFHL